MPWLFSLSYLSIIVSLLVIFLLLNGYLLEPRLRALSIVNHKEIGWRQDVNYSNMVGGSFPELNSIFEQRRNDEGTSLIFHWLWCPFAYGPLGIYLITLVTQYPLEFEQIALPVSWKGTANEGGRVMIVTVIAVFLSLTYPTRAILFLEVDWE